MQQSYVIPAHDRIHICRSGSGFAALKFHDCRIAAEDRSAVACGDIVFQVDRIFLRQIFPVVGIQQEL